MRLSQPSFRPADEAPGPRDTLHREIAKLRERIDELEEENRQLKQRSVPDAVFPMRWRLTEREDTFLRVLLAAPGVSSRETLLDAAYNQNADTPELKIVDVFICKLRKKLAPDGIAITTVWGRGFWLEPPGKALVRQAVEATANGIDWVSPAPPAKSRQEELQDAMIARSPNRGAHASTVRHTRAPMTKEGRDLAQRRGAVIQARRKRLGLTQDALAVQLNEIAAVVSNAENGRGWPSLLDALERVLDAEERKRCLTTVIAAAPEKPGQPPKRGGKPALSEDVRQQRRETGLLVRQGRKALGLTQADLANLAGAWETDVSMTERGLVGDGMMQRMAAALTAEHARRASAAAGSTTDGTIAKDENPGGAGTRRSAA